MTTAETFAFSPEDEPSLPPEPGVVREARDLQQQIEDWSSSDPDLARRWLVRAAEHLNALPETAELRGQQVTPYNHPNEIVHPRARYIFEGFDDKNPPETPPGSPTLFARVRQLGKATLHIPLGTLRDEKGSTLRLHPDPNASLRILK